MQFPGIVHARCSERRGGALPRGEASCHFRAPSTRAARGGPPLLDRLAVPDLEQIGRGLRPNAVVGQDRLRGVHEVLSGEHDRLTIALLELERDELVLQVAQYGDEVPEAADRRAVDPPDDVAGRVVVSGREWMREERRGNDYELLALRSRWPADFPHQR